MRALLSTIGSRGDVQPLVALARELRSLGQDVRLCVPPDFRGWVEGLGFAVTPIGPEVRKFAISRPASSPALEPSRSLVDESVATQFQTISEAAVGCDVIVAATALQVAARSVAQKMRIPYIFAAYCPIVLPSPHHAPPPLPPMPGQAPTHAPVDNAELWARDAQRFDETFGTALNSHRGALGLDAVHDVRQHMFTDHPWLAADPTLAPWPDPANQAVFQTGAWILPDDRPLPRPVESFLEAGEPPLYFGFGSMPAMKDSGAVLLDAARRLGRRAIVSRGWAESSVADNERDCLTIGEVNVHDLFPRVAAVVHHGGAGTTTAAALGGVPQIVVPQMYDQHYWGKRVHDLGIGSVHAPGIPTADSVTAALERTLQREIALRARKTAALMRRDGAVTAARRLLDGSDRG